jgi:hypothetical protein
MQHVAGQTGRVHSRQHFLAAFNGTMHERDVRLRVIRALVDVNLESTVLGRQLCGRHSADRGGAARLEKRFKPSPE